MLELYNRNCGISYVIRLASLFNKVRGEHWYSHRDNQPSDVQLGIQEICGGVIKLGMGTDGKTSLFKD